MTHVGEHGQRTDYLVDPQNPTGYAQVLEELLGGVVQKSYTIGHDVFAEAIAANQLRHLLKDGHNSTRQLVDALGNIITHDGTPSGTLQIYAYDAYGLALGFTPANALTTLLYNTEQLDKLTGLQYLRARYYDLATGRFNRLDPFAGSLSDPQLLHKYLFAHGDPIQGVDPTGLMTLTASFAAARVRATLRVANLGRIYAQKQAAISTLQTSIEYFVLKLLFPKAEFDFVRVFLTNFGGNLLTGGIGNPFLRNLADIAFNTLVDVWYEEDLATSLAINILGSFGSEALASAGGAILKRAKSAIGSAGDAADVADGLAKKGLVSKPGELLPNAPIGVTDGLYRIVDIRRQFNVSGRKNIAFAELDLGTGGALELRAVSGERARDAAQGFIPPPNSRGGITGRQRRFLTQADPLRNPANPRRYEAELIILENIANSVPQGASGRVRLFSQKPFCASCTNVIQQFRSMFPGIDLITSAGP